MPQYKSEGLVTIENPSIFQHFAKLMYLVNDITLEYVCCVFIFVINLEMQ